MGDMSLDNTSHVHQRAHANADFGRPVRDELVSSRYATKEQRRWR